MQLSQGAFSLSFLGTNSGDIATKATRDKLEFHVGSQVFNLGDGSYTSSNSPISWPDPGLSWSANDTVALKIVEKDTTAPELGERAISDLITLESKLHLV